MPRPSRVDINPVLHTPLYTANSNRCIAPVVDTELLPWTGKLCEPTMTLLPLPATRVAESVHTMPAIFVAHGIPSSLPAAPAAELAPNAAIRPCVGATTAERRSDGVVKPLNLVPALA